MASDNKAIIIVTYPIAAGTTFDADYYVGTHMPLVREKWSAYGLETADALMPAQDDPPYAAIASLTFRDEAAIDAALQSAETAVVMGDIANFTTITPVIQRCARG